MFLKHCSPRTFRVILGAHDLNSISDREQIIAVSAIYVHPQWDANKLSQG